VLHIEAERVLSEGFGVVVEPASGAGAALGWFSYFSRHVKIESEVGIERGCVQRYVQNFRIEAD
jgi:hypothetical protein